MLDIWRTLSEDLLTGLILIIGILYVFILVIIMLYHAFFAMLKR
jgi:hypothetical protein